MRLSEMHFGPTPPVEGYGPGFFRVGGRVFSGPVLLIPGGPVAWEGIPNLEPIVEHRAGFDVCLMGMGAEIAFLPQALREVLEDVGIGVETMATPAACRTYNVLLAEERRIAAALMPI